MFEKVKKVADASGKPLIEEGLFYVARIPEEDESLFDCVMSEGYGMTLEAKHFIDELSYKAFIVRAVKIGEKIILIPIRG